MNLKNQNWSYTDAPNQNKMTNPTRKDLQTNKKMEKLRKSRFILPA